MLKRICVALISLAAVAATPSSAAGVAAACDDRQCHHAHARQTRRHTGHARQRTRKGRSRRAVAYVCPMHPDVRERRQGTCPKCLMDLVAEPRGSKANARGASAAGGI